MTSRRLKDLDALAAIEASVGYTFKNRALLTQALTHRSFAHEAADGEANNEPLEFLGDAVIGMLVAERLVRKRSDLSEGGMTRLRSSLVNARSLAAEAERLGLGRCLRLGKGEERSGGRHKTSLLADAFEAVTGAIFLDGGLTPTRRFVNQIFGHEIEVVSQRKHHERRDPKTELQERVQALGRPLPEYRLLEESGPDHAREFVVEVWIEHQPYARGVGTSKKRAEQQAAAASLTLLAPREP